MQTWDGKKKGRENLFNLDRLEALVDELMEELMSDEEFERLDGGKPVIFGFSLRFDQAGKPRLEEFGNVKRKADKLVKTTAREPLVDVSRDGENVVISAELPGVAKKDLKVNGTQASVILEVRGERPFYKEIALGQRIVPGSVKALFKNGILEVSLRTLPPARGGKEIAVY